VVGGNAGVSLNVTVCEEQKQNFITRLHGSAKQAAIQPVPALHERLVVNPMWYEFMGSEYL
jgi:hypothetical protein